MNEAVPDHCVCEGRGLFRDPETNQYLWCICRRLEQNDNWASRCVMGCGIRFDVLAATVFDAWHPSINPGCNGAKKAVKLYADGTAGRPWLVLVGARGLGKTHLAVAATGVMAGRGIEVVYRRVQDLATELREAVGDNTVSHVIRRLAQVNTLIIDDIGAEHRSAFLMSEMQNILDKRYFERRKTVLTSNEPLASFPPRLASRMSDFRTVQVWEMEGQDARPRLGAEGEA